MSKEDHRGSDVPLSAALLAEDPNEDSEQGLEREQMGSEGTAEALTEKGTNGDATNQTSDSDLATPPLRPWYRHVVPP